MYRLNEEKMFFDMADGQAVVISVVTGMYCGATALGSVIPDRRQAGGLMRVRNAEGGGPPC